MSHALRTFQADRELQPWTGIPEELQERIEQQAGYRLQMTAASVRSQGKRLLFQVSTTETNPKLIEEPGE